VEELVMGTEEEEILETGLGERVVLGPALLVMLPLLLILDLRLSKMTMMNDNVLPDQAHVHF
jgi:hypothetical protein